MNNSGTVEATEKLKYSPEADFHVDCDEILKIWKIWKFDPNLAKFWILTGLL